MGNLIFSRRCLQERLLDLGEVLPLETRQKLAKRLNTAGRDRLAAMWEVVWLAALARGRSINHEESLSNGARPDFTFDVACGGGTLRVVGDITSASDRGLNDRNPVGTFWEEVGRLVQKYQLDPNEFSYHIGHDMVGPYRDAHVKLSLPARNELRSYLKRRVEPFLKSLKDSPQDTRRLVCNDPGIAFTITYKKGQQCTGGGHIVYSIPYSYTKNPLFNALEKKAIQLSAAPDDAVRLVILCDAGCEALRPSIFSGGSSLTASEVVQEYLRRSSSIDLVLLVTIEHLNPTDVWRSHRRVNATFVQPPVQGRERRLTSVRAKAVRHVIEEALKSLPQPKIDATNAAIRMSNTAYGNALHGGYKLSSGRSSAITVRISARAVLELLSGKIGFEEFQRMHHWADGLGPFVRALRNGALIRRSELVDGGDADDDWLEFKLDGPDPAVTPFQVDRPDPGEISEPLSDQS